MKHFINILVTLIIVGFAVGTTWICFVEPMDSTRPWGVLYVPVLICIFGWGFHLANSYGDY